jgi:hypothetical protein
MLSNTAVRSAGLQGCPGRGIGRTPIYREMTSVAAMMLAADRIAPIVLAASPELRDALYRKYFGVSEEWLRSHGSAEAEEAKRRSTRVNRWRGV